MPKSSEVVTAMRVQDAPNVSPAIAAIGTSSISAHCVSDKNEMVRNSAAVHAAVAAELTTQKNVLGVPCRPTAYTDDDVCSMNMLVCFISCHFSQETTFPIASCLMVWNLTHRTILF